MKAKLPMLYTLTMFMDDMGSYSTKCHGVDDALWHVNSAREHDGLRPITAAEFDRLRRSKGSNRARLTPVRRA